MKLAAKLILLFLLGVLAIASLFGWQTIRRQHDWEEQRRAAHASDLAETLAPTIKRAYEAGGTVTIQQAIEISTRKLTGPQVRWIEGSELLLPNTETTSRRSASILISDASGNRKAYSYVPMTLSEHDSGTVEVAEPLNDHDAFTWRAILTSLVSLAGVGAVSALVIFVGGVHFVGKPLGRLISQVNAIGEGNLDQSPAIQSNDELGQLALAISNMSHRIRQQRDTIRHADRLGTIGTLAAGMAHELGTPLNVVSGRAGLIKSGKLTPDEVRASAETIQAEADRMTKIIRQLLDFARQAPSPHQRIALNSVVSQTCDLMRPFATKANVFVDVQIPDNPLQIDGDTAQVQQVLTNLLTNAIAAMPNGGTVTVALSLTSDHNIQLLVTDTGVGIPNTDIGHIFEPFFTTKDVGQGTGLGLSIAYGLVQDHGGEIQVKTKPNEGTTFTVTFPAPTDYNDNRQALGKS